MVLNYEILAVQSYVLHKPETCGRETPDAAKLCSLCKIDSCFLLHLKGGQRDKGTKGQTCFEKGTKAKRKISNNIYNYNYIYYYINIIE